MLFLPRHGRVWRAQTNPDAPDILDELAVYSTNDSYYFHYTGQNDFVEENGGCAFYEKR